MKRNSKISNSMLPRKCRKSGRGDLINMRAVQAVPLALMALPIIFKR